MNDFFDDLKEIKKDMLKSSKKVESKSCLDENSKDNDSSFKEVFDLSKESVEAREKRLKDEFLEYTKDADIKRI
ncbi:MAG: hypothetical protein GXZ15_01730 [Campylobacter sp.]|nr:hypothetical protein [Campylobacter sp.]